MSETETQKELRAEILNVAVGEMRGAVLELLNRIASAGLVESIELK